MEDGIVRVKIKDNARVELNDALEHVATVRELCGGQKCPMLTDISRVRSTSRQARAAYGGDSATQVLSALALLTGSPISRVIGTFFVHVSRPSCPTKVFSDEAAALSWLRDRCPRP